MLATTDVRFDKMIIRSEAVSVCYHRTAVIVYQYRQSSQKEQDVCLGLMSA